MTSPSNSIFDKINASTVRKTAIVTQGSHEPSGVDINGWRRWLSHFGQASTNLCKALVAFAWRLATEQMQDLSPYNACRLIPLEKNPCVRPIGVGEIIGRIIGRITSFDASETTSSFWARLGNSALIKNMASNTPFTVSARRSNCQRGKGFSS